MTSGPASDSPSRESGGILWRWLAPLHIPDQDNATGRIGAAGHKRRVHGPGPDDWRLAHVSQFKLCILPFGEQAHCAAFPQEGKTLVEQWLERGDGACCDDIGRAVEARRELL